MLAESAGQPLGDEEDAAARFGEVNVERTQQLRQERRQRELLGGVAGGAVANDRCPIL